MRRTIKGLSGIVHGAVGWLLARRRAMPLAALEAMLAAERERWALWVPVLFGFGIAGYFALPWEPPLWWGPVVAIAAAIGLWCMRGRSVIVTLTLSAVLCAGLGLGWAGARTQIAAAPTLARDAGALRFEGLAAAVEPFPDGPRVRLTGLDYLWRAPDGAPSTVRVKLRKGERVEIGERLRLTAVLRPPPRPAYPDGYDFARRAWFEGLGAVGFALSRAERVAPGPETPAIGPGTRFWAAVDRLRQRIGRAVMESLPGERGAIAAALITGDRSGISEPSLEALRQSGLAHLLAISGLHIGLVAMSVFVGVRRLMAAVPGVALAAPIKKFAAGAALIATFGYLMLAGATPPTQRAALMTGLVLLAVIADRKAISMRAVAIAAAVLLLWRPESLTGASFQLSFAAVTALVAVYESWRPLQREEGAGASDADSGWAGRLPRRAFAYFLLIVSTTLIAGAATGPFALHHFGRVANYGVIGNLVAIPLMAFLVMPAGVLGVLLLPLGLADPFLAAMGAGIAAILGIGEMVAALPGSVLHLPASPAWAAALIAGGGLWAAIWRGRWRWWGAVPVAAGLMLPLTLPQPQAVLSETGRLIALSDTTGALRYSNTRRERFAADMWREQTGRPAAGSWSDWLGAPGPSPPLACGPVGCVYAANGRTLAISRDPRSLPEDCRRADIVIATVGLPPALATGACRTRLVIDPPRRIVEGTHALYLTEDGVRAVTVQQARGDRPWTRSR